MKSMVGSYLLPYLKWTSIFSTEKGVVAEMEHKRTLGYGNSLFLDLSGSFRYYSPHSEMKL